MGEYEFILNEKLVRIPEPDRSAESESRKRWDSLAKPLDGLGRFEEMIVQLAGIQRTVDVETTPRAAVVMCGDHGVVCEHVTQTGSVVTTSVARAISENASTVNVLAKAVSADVFAVDLGMNRDEEVPGLLDCSVGRGTQNIAKGPAMSRENACQAILEGMNVAASLASKGYRMLAAGEMGIGNTTAASAIMAVISDVDPALVTGRGAGLSDGLYSHKIEIVRQAVLVNRPDRSDPLDILSKLGGYEIAGMVGLYIGGALTGTAIVIDGLTSSVSALIAKRLCPDAGEYMLAAHTGREPASSEIMRLLEKKPVMDASMALGEATGAVLLFPLLDAALELYRKGETFEQIHVEPYERYQQP